jgi:hypothetical protein
VWVGEEGFADLAAGLWDNLWPAARRSFRFRISFDPSDSEGFELALVATLEETRGRWSGAVLVGRQSNRQPTTASEALLLGLPAGDALRRVLEEMGGGPAELHALARIEEAYRLAESLEVADAFPVVRLVRVLSAAAPAAELARGMKDRAVSRLVQLLPGASEEIVLGLRNLPADRFPGRLAELGKAVTDWTFVRGGSGAGLSASVVESAFVNPGEWWGASVLAGLRATLASMGAGTASLLWKWWSDDANLVEVLGAGLDPGRKQEKTLAEAAPARLPMAAGEAVMRFAEARGWQLVHAAAASGSLDPIAAVERHLCMNPEPGNPEAIGLLMKRLPASALVAAAIRTGDSRIVTTAGCAAAKDPRLLTDLDASNEHWRAVWAAALDAGGEIYPGVPRLALQVAKLLDQELDLPGSVPGVLFDAIASTPEADLWNYPQRAEVWTSLSAPRASRFLAGTADGWLRRYWSAEEPLVHLETELERAVLKSAQLLPRTNPIDADQLARGIALAERYDQIAEAIFRPWAESAVARLPRLLPSDARRLGRLIMHRRWRGMAEWLFGSVGQRPDLRPAFEECVDLLPKLERLWAALTGVVLSRDPKVGWWEALAETGAELFRGGPTQDYLWQRAGGDESRLSGRTPREKWYSAADLLNRGGGGKDLKIRRLLDAMLEERPSNPELRSLIDAYERIF